MKIRPAEYLRHFLRDTRAGATAIAAVAVTLMTVGATALTVDHLLLVDQRDTLKAAANAAGTATTLELGRLLDNDPTITDAALKNALAPIARRYVEFNLGHLPADRLARAKATLAVDLAISRGQRTVNVNAAVDLGGTLLSGSLSVLGDAAPPGGTTQAVTQVESLVNPVEVVLALDISTSMDRQVGPDPRICNGCEDSRLNVVKRSASRLVDILAPSAINRVAVGVVPWGDFVRLDAETASTWETNGWAVYPTTRLYPEPYGCAGECSPPPPASAQGTAPAAPQDWNGCLNSDRTGAVHTRAALPDSVDDALDTPSERPFAQAFFPAGRAYAYECLTTPFPSGATWQNCFSGTRSYYSAGAYQTMALTDAEYGCADDHPSILPLSNDPAEVKAAIDALAPVGYQTYSALGVLWAQGLLDSSWNAAWGGGRHPVEPDDDDGLRKVIVLLTDGKDTHCGTGQNCLEDASKLGFLRSEACSAAKAEGSEIFVITAMHPHQVTEDLAASLRACSSASDESDNTYVFIGNQTADDLEAAFSDIANQLRSVRRVY